MLEDDFTYVLKKALTGNGLAPSEAAAIAGLPEGEVLAFLRGNFSAETARRIAPVLGLDPEAFANHADYEPDVTLPHGIHRLDLSFGHERVNAWLICHGDHVILFDAGHEAVELIDAVKRAVGRMPDRVFVTHAHRDHVAALPVLLDRGVPVHAAGIDGTIPMKPGDTVQSGGLTVTARDLAGHAVPALGFQVDGLGFPLLVTGDAIFAGSIGGCATPAIYRMALERIRAVTANLAEETLLLPGHGPATTMGSERRRNPFL
jgi:glyoxylase-like metal-dependent hydrolase (beta-lactamase superfamily II)